MKDLMDEFLLPIAEEAHECIDSDLRFVVNEEDEEPWWKLIFLGFICFKQIVMMVGHIQQRQVLNRDTAQEYSTLKDNVKELLPFEQLEEAQVMNRTINKSDFIWTFAYFLIDFSVILLDAPAFVWYGWLKVFKDDEICGETAAISYGIYMQLAIAILFYITMKAIKEIWLTSFRAYDVVIYRRHGLSETTCCQFICQTVVSFFLTAFFECPLLILTAALITWLGDYFALATIVATFLVSMVQLYVYPKICCCDRKIKPLPEEQAQLQGQIEKLCQRLEFPHKDISLVEDTSGDLHSNAFLEGNSVFISDQMLVHHKDHNDEILAVVAHEIAHWKYSHSLKMALINIIYVVIFAAVMTPLINHKPFLAAFNFDHENVFILLFLFVHLYVYTIDIPLRLCLNKYSRKCELEADAFAVREAHYGESLRNGLVRNFSQNKDLVFEGYISKLKSTHPGLLERVETIEKLLDKGDRKGDKLRGRVPAEVDQIRSNKEEQDKQCKEKQETEKSDGKEDSDGQPKVELLQIEAMNTEKDLMT